MFLSDMIALLETIYPLCTCRTSCKPSICPTLHSVGVTVSLSLSSCKRMFHRDSRSDGTHADVPSAQTAGQ